MKRIIGLVGFAIAALYVVALPQAAFGQTVGTRYGTGRPCPAYITPRGTYQYPSGVDEKTIGISVDPVFAVQMKKERFLDNLPVTPIYDLVVEVVPTWGTCYTETPEDFPINPPKELPFKVSIVAEGETIVGPGGFVLSNRRDEKGRLLYEWKIPGWMDGIAKGEKLEKLIKAITANTPINLVVEVPRQDGTVSYEKSPVTMGNCAPLWGSGVHKFIYERGVSAGISVSIFVGKTEDVITNGFRKMDPFATYQQSFSHIIDLAIIDDNERAKKILSSLGKKLTPGALIDTIVGGSSCGLSSTANDDHYNYILRGDLSGAVITGVGSTGAASIEAYSSMNGAAVVHYPLGAEMVMHEVGHFFGKLRDEEAGSVMGRTSESSARAEKFMVRNCSLNPLSDFAYNGRLYSNKPDESVHGCSHLKYLSYISSPKSGKRTGNVAVYRSTPTSLMNYEVEGVTHDKRFSGVACGWIIAEIKESGSGPEYFPECMRLDVVKPSGGIASVSPERLLASVVSTVTPVTEISGSDDAVVFERLTPPAAGVVWYDGEPMPASLTFPQPSPSSLQELIPKLRARVQELTKQRDELRTRRDILRGVWSVPTGKTSPSPLLNAVPLHQQLGDISAALQSILESIQAAAR